MKFSRRSLIAAAFLGSVSLSACTPPAPKVDEDIAQADATIFLVRHAEKQGGDNPSLTEDGQTRAIVLASILENAELTSIYSTDFKRTMETATPTARVAGLVINTYDPNNLSSFAAKLRQIPGNHLVVGHSNTTPELVADLRGNPDSPIEEATEYDRLYILTLKPDGEVTTLVERYGPPNPE